jgi:hypothetical protein
MDFKFRKGNIFKIENGVRTQITRAEYEALKGKQHGSSKTKISAPEETSADEQEVIRESESGSEEEV